MGALSVPHAPKTPKGGICNRQGILYKTTCLRCKSEGRTTNYIGESGPSMLERYGEHLQDAQTKSSSSHMETHRAQEHPDREDSRNLFRGDVIATESSALVRMVKEAVLIREYKGDNLLNDILEYNRCLIPEITTRVGHRVMEQIVSKQDGALANVENTSDMKRGRDRDDQSIENDDNKEETQHETQKHMKMMKNNKKHEENNLKKLIQKIRIRNKLAKYKFTPKFTTEHSNNKNLQNLQDKFAQFPNVTFVVEAPVDVIVVDNLDNHQVGFENLKPRQE